MASRWLILVAMTVAGCGKTGPELAEVRGVITLGERPMRDVIVTFRPTGQTAGNGAHGATDAQGRFELADVRGGKGARPGQYKVHLYPAPVKSHDGAPSEVASLGNVSVPAVYVDPNTSPISAAVPAEGTSLQIRLTRDGKNISVVNEPLAP